MGWEPLNFDDSANEEVIGNQPFDAMADAIEAIAQFYRQDWERLPSLNEMTETFKQALETRIGDVVQEGINHELTSVRSRIKKRPKRQKYSVGDLLQGTLLNGEKIYGRVFIDQDPGMGPHVGVYDSKGMRQNQLEEIITQPLIVKVFPIHFEILQDRSEWLVVGNIPITKNDKKHPMGPSMISGQNCQLHAANYYYGLTDKEMYNQKEWLTSS